MSPAYQPLDERETDGRESGRPRPVRHRRRRVCVDKAKAASGDRRLFDAMGTEHIELLSALT